MLTGRQIRAARGLLDWTQGDLATASGIAVGSVKNFEGGKTGANPQTVVALQKALQDAGIILLAPSDKTDGGAGVRLKEIEP